MIVEVWLSFKRHHMRFREWLFEPIWLIQRTWSRFVLFPCEIQKHWLYAMTELMEKSQSSSKLVCRSQMASTSNRQFKSNEDSWIENRFSSEVHIRNQRSRFNQRFAHSLVRQFSSIWRGARTRCKRKGDRKKKHRKYSNKINQMYILSTIFNAMQKCIYRNMTLPLSSESEWKLNWD